MSWSYRFIRNFHDAAQASMVQSESQKLELQSRGLRNLHVVGGGVDTDFFVPEQISRSSDPTLLYVGRISKEKNIEDFLELDRFTTKLVVGEGPHRRQLERDYPQASFLGLKRGKELVDLYNQADCLVFPSRSDTFGLVMVEANACGTPVAAYPTTGPADVIKEGISGCLRSNLEEATLAALQLDRAKVREHSEHFAWDRVATRFLDLLMQAKLAR